MLDAQLDWLSQELVGFEHECDIVVSDNCSTDNTPQVIESWQRRFNGRISVTAVRHDYNIGGMPNIVHAISLAKGTFVWSLGDDDPIQRGAVPYILGKINEHPNLSLILLNGCGRDGVTNKILQERWFESSTDRPSKNSASEFEVFLDKYMGGVLFISAAVYRTALVHQAFATWPECTTNLASQAYWVAYCAARGSFIVTPQLFTEATMRIGFTDNDPTWSFNLIYRGIPEVYIRLMRSGYSKSFCFQMMLRNVRSLSAWRVLGGCVRRWPLFGIRGLVYYVRWLFIGMFLLLPESE
jgi:glycosyltransferase involved in cell wall biosynthesis